MNYDYAKTHEENAIAIYEANHGPVPEDVKKLYGIYREAVEREATKLRTDGFERFSRSVKEGDVRHACERAGISFLLLDCCI